VGVCHDRYIIHYNGGFHTSIKCNDSLEGLIDLSKAIFLLLWFITTKNYRLILANEKATLVIVKKRPGIGF
jgi:hypothetical protein